MATKRETIDAGNAEDDALDDETTAADGLVGSLLEGFDTAAILTDPDGEVIALNDAAQAVFGLDRFQVIGQSLADVLPANALDLVGTASNTLTETDEVEETVEIAGEEVPLLRSVSVCYDEGDVAGFLEIDRDISERRKQERRKELLETYQRTVLDDLQSNLSRLAAGDLTIETDVPTPPADFEELGTVHREFDSMNEDLTAAVTNIRRVIDRLTADASTLADRSERLSGTTEEVTASVDEIEASTAEMADGSQQLATQSEDARRNVGDLSAAIEEITASLEQIMDQAGDTSDLADDGVEDVSVAVRRIREATQAADSVAAEMDVLDENMTEVANIIDIMATIADQTNLLALNANIEAARAGEAGSGFAVVANEVKSLAEESQTAADDIGGIIETTQTQTGAVVSRIRDANAGVREGADAVEEVVDALDAIQERATQTTEGVEEIADAVGNQAENAESVSGVVEDSSALAQQLSASLQQIATGVDQQADAMDEVAETAISLAGMSDDVHAVVDAFKVDDDENAALEDEMDDILD